jgi:hypothetical protein
MREWEEALIQQWPDQESDDEELETREAHSTAKQKTEARRDTRQARQEMREWEEALIQQWPDQQASEIEQPKRRNDPGPEDKQTTAEYSRGGPFGGPKATDEQGRNRETKTETQERYWSKRRRIQEPGVT